MLKPLASPGERILCKPMSGGRTASAKMEPRFRPGIFLGIVERTGEVIVGLEDGTVGRCRDFKRVVPSERWDKELVLNLKGLPWATDGETETGSEVVPRLASLDQPVAGASGAAPPMMGAPAPASRALYVTKRLIGKNGPTAGCSACGGQGIAHSFHCRDRIAAAIFTDESEHARYGIEVPQSEVRSEAAASAADDATADASAAQAPMADVSAVQAPAQPAASGHEAPSAAAPTMAMDVTVSPTLHATLPPTNAGNGGDVVMGGPISRSREGDDEEGAPESKAARLLAITCEEELDLNDSDKEEEVHDEEEFFDEVTGLALETKPVHKAMTEELGEYDKHEVYEVVTVASCVATTGKQPEDCRWRISNKGDAMAMDIRARLIARQMKKRTKGWESVFAGTPPLWAFRALCSSVRSHRKNQRKPRKLRILDIKRAFFHAIHSGSVHVMPPHLRGTCMCWRLK